MPPKKKVKLNESREVNLVWTDDEVQLLFEVVRTFKAQKLCGSTTLFDPATSLLFSETYFFFSSSNVNLFLCSSQFPNVYGIQS